MPVLPRRLSSSSAATPLLARDYQSLSLFRILFAIYLGIFFFHELAPYYRIFFTDDGILPRAALAAAYPDPDILTLLQYTDYWPAHLALIIAQVLALICFGIGYKTRLANFVLFVTYTSLFWRNPMLNSHGELMAKLLLLWSLFLPMARYWSVDAALDPEPRDRPYPLVPFLAIRLQIASLYFFSAIFKLAGKPWWDGSAITMAFRDNIVGGTNVGLWVADRLGGLAMPLAWSVIVFQLLFSFLIYCPWKNNSTRGFALIAAALMHISFIFTMNIGFFPYICLAYLVILVPDQWWNALLARRRARLGHMRVFYEPGCAFCKKTALLFREFCLAPTVSVVSADKDAAALALLRKNNSWVVYGAEGQTLMHWRAVAYVLRQNPFLWIFGALTDLSPLRPLMRILYDWIGHRRPLFGKLTALFLPMRAQPQLPVAASVLCAFLMLVALAYNISDARAITVPLDWYRKTPELAQDKTPVWLTGLAAYLQVRQKWDLFAPVPTRWQKRISLVGIKPDGSNIELAGLWSPSLFQLDANEYSMDFANHRWRRYFSILDSDEAGQRAAFAQFMCRQAGGLKAVHLKMTTQPESTPWNPAAPPRVDLSYPCP